MDRKDAGAGLAGLERPQPLYLRAYEQLREAIIDGRLAPGQRLVETEVAGWLRVSRTPVREALRKLEQDGLVQIVDGYAEVYRPSPNDVYAIYVCRAAIEGMAAYSAVLNATAADIEALEATHARLAEAHDRNDKRACVELNTRFHDQIISLAGNDWLAKMHTMLRVHVLLVRYYNLDQHTRPDLVVDQHRLILDAFRAQDPQGARRAMEAHIAANRDAGIAKLPGAIRQQASQGTAPEGSETQ